MTALRSADQLLLPVSTDSPPDATGPFQGKPTNDGIAYPLAMSELSELLSPWKF